MLTSLICDSFAQTGQCNSFVSRCEMLNASCVLVCCLITLCFLDIWRRFCITIIIWFLVCYYIIVMWYMLKQIQSLDLLINSCKENPLGNVISPVCPGTRVCFISTLNCRITSSIRLTSWQLGVGAVSRSWSYGSWNYNHLCNQCLSPLTLWVRTPFMAKCIRYNIMW
jgi:hypothetical protein